MIPFLRNIISISTDLGKDILDEIKNKHDEDSNENLILSKLNINSDLIKTPFEIKEKDIETDNKNDRCTIPKKILDKLINSMIESIFNINFAIIDFLNVIMLIL